MKIKPAIRTREEIEKLVTSFNGTWVKRRNARGKLTQWSNDLINKEIELQKTRIRQLKTGGAKECDLRPHYREITKLELRLI